MKDKNPYKNKKTDNMEIVGFTKSVNYKSGTINFRMSHNDNIYHLNIFTGCKKFRGFGEVIKTKIIDIVSEKRGVFVASGRFHNTATFIAEKIDFKDSQSQIDDFCNFVLEQKRK